MAPSMHACMIACRARQGKGAACVACACTQGTLSYRIALHALPMSACLLITFYDLATWPGYMGPGRTCTCLHLHLAGCRASCSPSAGAWARTGGPPTMHRRSHSQTPGHTRRPSPFACATTAHDTTTRVYSPLLLICERLCCRKAPLEHGAAIVKSTYRDVMAAERSWQATDRGAEGAYCALQLRLCAVM